MIRIAVCDDDSRELEYLSEYIKRFMKEKNIEADIFAAADPKELVAYIEKKNIDILFLDIDMPEINGMEIAEKYVSESTLLIFVSQYENLVYKSLKYNPFRFIRKSEIDEIDEALESCIKKIEDFGYKFKLKNREFIYLKTRDVLYFEGYKNYIIIHTANGGSYFTRETMKNIESIFNKRGFVRIHNGYTVNLRYIETIGISELKLTDFNKNKIKLPVSDKYKDDFLKAVYKYSRR